MLPYEFQSSYDANKPNVSTTPAVEVKNDVGNPHFQQPIAVLFSVDNDDIAYQDVPFIRHTRIPDLKGLFDTTARIRKLVVKYQSKPRDNVRVFLLAWKVRVDGSPYIYNMRKPIMDLVFVEIGEDQTIGAKPRRRNHPLEGVFKG